ncbi:phosphatase PAP2 family protein [Streptomyces gobitricini]|uniref:Phosphatidic acid phosphatase type 2/haloperoxidase domain-containing protein n=1 Tax=Streptomyces gobitricini TaxID=68211 RepID=A0ABN3M2P6_9ACTN
MTTGGGVAAGRIGALVPLPFLGLFMVGAGLLITGPAAARWPFSAEDAVNTWFAGRRSGTATVVSEWLAFAASTESVIGVTLACAVALIVLPRAARWTEALFLVGSVAAQSLLFLLVTACVERPRPDVPRLDPAPPTSSFPSGHAGAALALYGGLATLAVSRLRGPWRYVVAGLLLVVPPAVAVSRVYRGMHHPSDVVGGLVNGAGVLLVMAHALLSPPPRPDRPWDRAPGAPGAAGRPGSRPGRERRPRGGEVPVTVGPGARGAGPGADRRAGPPPPPPSVGGASSAWFAGGGGGWSGEPGRGRGT